MQSKQQKIETKKFRKFAQKQIKQFTDPDFLPSEKENVFKVVLRSRNLMQSNRQAIKSNLQQKHFQKQDDVILNLAEKIRELQIQLKKLIRKQLLKKPTDTKSTSDQ